MYVWVGLSMMLSIGGLLGRLLPDGGQWTVALAISSLVWLIVFIRIVQVKSRPKPYQPDYNPKGRS